MNVLQPTGPNDAGAEKARRTAAYEQGQRDARAGVTDTAAAAERDVAARRAYERGRRDERARHTRRRGFPMLTLILLLAAAAGVFIIYLGVREGSFSRGGQLVDQNINNTTATATQATQNAADKAGDALENAGQRIKQTAGSGK